MCVQERERGQWTVYYTGSQSFVMMLTILGTLINFDWLVHLVECQNGSTTNCNLHKWQFSVYPLGMNIILTAILDP